ncbi:NeuD/PglB/VioB family sugar acetyltransferase [Flavobacterium sp.]|uniref:NeuD/PglB/VioB family sugar acetyltransferase n=1 Tax=Flavobacterium sp. TaxID=239 RepID=UPI0035280573
MLDLKSKIAIFGCGGLSKEIYYCIKDIFILNQVSFEGKIVFVDKEVKEGDYFLNCPIIKQDDFEVKDYQVVLAIGNPNIRKQIVSSLSKNTFFPTIVHPTVQMNETATVGKGVLILQNAVISCDVTIGDFTIVDRAVQVGHDCNISNFVHLSPASVLSGNINLHSCIEIGTNASLKQNIEIVQETTIGMGSVVVKSILEKGVYVGNPAQKIK